MARLLGSALVAVVLLSGCAPDTYSGATVRPHIALANRVCKDHYGWQTIQNAYWKKSEGIRTPHGIRVTCRDGVTLRSTMQPEDMRP